MMVKDKKPFIFLAQAQQLFFLDDVQMTNWKVVVHKEPQSSHITMDSFSNSSGIDDGVPWLNTPITHPSMLQEARPRSYHQRNQLLSTPHLLIYSRQFLGVQ
jgi:hypothetical protein